MTANPSDDAREFFIREWNDEKIRIHSECMIDACLGMINHTELDRDVFIIAGWLHDLGRKIDKDTHHQLSIDFLDRFLQEHTEYSHLHAKIRDCILNHRTDGKPGTIYGIVFRAADKLSLHDVRWLRYKKMSNKTE